MLSTIGDRMIAHLSGYDRYEDEYDCPVELTQEGIGRALGISRPHVALEVRRQVADGRVRQRLAHVRGSRNRRKVYFLTLTGHARLAELREAARGRLITIVYPDGDRRQLPGADAASVLMAAGAREHQALVRLLETEIVEVRGGAGAPRLPERFVGRREELERLRAFASGGSGLLVIHGPRGIGKTALASALVRSHPGPAVWCAARRGEGRERLLEALASTLQEGGRSTLAECLGRADLGANALEAVRRDARGLLVVLDEADASPDAVAFARSCVAAGADLRVLLVARSDLGIAPAIQLGPVSTAAAAALLAARRPDLPPEKVTEAAEASNGVPLLMELAAHAPGSDPLGALLAAIEPREVEALRLAATFGPVFPAEALPRSYLALRTLVWRGLVVRTLEGFTVPAMVRDRVLSGLCRGDRLALQSRAAAYYAEDGMVLLEARHLLDADRAEEAVSRLVQESARLLRLGRAPTLAGLLGEGILRGAGSPSGALAYSEACLASGLASTARETAAALRDHEDLVIRIRAHLTFASASMALEDLPTASASFAVARRLAAAAVDALSEGRACRGLAEAQRLLGNPHGAVELFIRAERLLTAGGRRGEADDVRLRHALALADGGDAPAGLALLRPLRARPGDLGVRAVIATAQIESPAGGSARELAERHGLYDGAQNVPLVETAPSEMRGFSRPEAPRDLDSMEGMRFTAAQQA